jgi:hypothetical protein
MAAALSRALKTGRNAVGIDPMIRFSAQPR